MNCHGTFKVLRVLRTILSDLLATSALQKALNKFKANTPVSVLFRRIPDFPRRDTTIYNRISSFKRRNFFFQKN